MYSRFQGFLLGALLTALPLSSSAQSELQQRTLVVNGHRGTVTIYRISGQSYINLESLVQIADGSLSFQGNEIILNMSATTQEHSPRRADTAEGMSKQFMSASVQALAQVRQWYTVMAQAIERGVPGDGRRLVGFRDKAAEGVRLASIAASNESDSNAQQLLSNHFGHVDAWYQKLVGERKLLSSAHYSMNDEALAKDPDYQKITSCSKFLGAMLGSAKYEDDASCR
jgi:hypothetical protein